MKDILTIKRVLSDGLPKITQPVLQYFNQPNLVKGPIQLESFAFEMFFSFTTAKR